MEPNLNRSDETSDQESKLLPAVPITQIKEYEKNPRVEPHQNFAELKESIRTRRGLDQLFTVTRRPGEDEYVQYAGGQHRLRALRELYEETQDEVFFYTDCQFKPYTNEFDLMVAHAGENLNRASLMWVDKARLVYQLRAQLESKIGVEVSQQELSKEISKHGWRVSQANVSRLLYTHDLLPAIPKALRAGLGNRDIDKIRRLEACIKQYLRFRAREDELKTVQQWFVGCLEQHDSEAFSLEPVVREAVDRLSNIFDEPAARIRLDIEAIQRGSVPPTKIPESADFAPLRQRPKPEEPPEGSHISHQLMQTTPVGDNVHVPESVDADSDIRSAASDKISSTLAPEADSDVDFVKSNAPVGSFAVGTDRTASDQNIRDLRSRMRTLATQLVQHNQLGECVYPIGCAGGFLIDLPESPLFRVMPPTAEDYKRIALWWFLAGLTDQFLNKHAGAVANALPEDARLAGPLELIRSGDADTQRSANVAITSFVSKPPSLDSVIRNMIARLDNTEFHLVVSLLDARRLLSRQTKSTDLWGSR